MDVESGGEGGKFKGGGAVVFPKTVGGKRRFAVDRLEFAGYGLDAPAAHHEDYADPRLKNAIKGAAAVWLGSRGPKGLDPQKYRRLLTGRHRYATEQMMAAASI